MLSAEVKHGAVQVPVVEDSRMCDLVAAIDLFTDCSLGATIILSGLRQIGVIPQKCTAEAVTSAFALPCCVFSLL